MKTVLKSLFLLLVISFFSSEILAQTKLSVQGVIRLSDGNAIEDGLYPITFKLYDTIVGGNLLWTELQTQLKVTSGIYSTILGEVTPLDLEFDEFYYLSLTVEGEELLPRAPLTSAPYSNSVLGFDNVFPSSGNVGIGTLTPTSKLEVAGKATFDTIGIGVDNPLVPFQVNSNSKFNGNLDINSNVFYADGDNVGIGTNNPSNSYKLDVNGKIRSNNGFWVTSGINRAFDYVTSCLNSGETIFSADVWACPDANFNFINFMQGGSKFRVNNAGNVYINGTLIHSSDKRLKENFKSVSNVLQQLNKINAYSYNMIENEDDDREYGLIAQEVQEVFPDVVEIINEENGYLGVSYMQIVPLLVEAAKELKAENEALLQTSIKLQKQIDDFVTDNKGLKKAFEVQSNATNVRLSQLEIKLNEILQIQSVSKL